jgi:hypothetical protein
MNRLTSFFAVFIFLAVMILPAMADEAKPDAAAAPPPAAVQEEKPTFDFTTYALSKYVWRGYEETKNGIVIQPSMTVGYKGFSVNVWGNLDTRPYAAAPNTSYSSAWTETDFTFSYNKTFGLVNAGVGYIYYGLDAANPGGVKPLDAEELFATVGLNTLLTPTLTVYKEIDHYHQWYFLLGVSHSIELSKAVSLKLAASGSYLKSEDASPNDSLNVGYPKYTDSGQPTADKFSNFHDGQISASLPIAVAKYMTVTPIISYSCPLSNDAKNEIKARSKNGQDSDFLYGGVGFTFAF